MNEIIESLKNRKSVRVYENRLIEPVIEDAILDAAIQAPTAGNMMLYSIIHITEQSLKDRLAVTCDNQPFIASAPLLLLVTADYQRYYDSFENVVEGEIRKPGVGDLLLALSDALIAAQNMVVAAESFGIGSCYIGDIIENYEIHRQLLHLPEYVLPIALICFGYPTEQQKMRPKPERFDKKFIVHTNEYRKLSTEEQMEMHGVFSCEEYHKKIGALYNRKYNSDFAKEMTRSVKVMLDNWSK